MNDQLFQLLAIFGAISIVAPWLVIFALLTLLAWSGGFFDRRGAGGVVTTPQPLSPAAPPPPPPPAPPKPRFTNIVATSFAGQGDVESSAYTGRVIDGDQLGCALPYHFSGTIPTLSVFYGGKSVSGIPIVDIGPWNTNDPYWNNGGRPEAETGTDNSGRRTNLAGIDLTPGTWEALGYQGDASAVKDKVDWDFDSYLKTPTATSPTSPAPVTGDPPWLVLGRTFNGLVWSQNSGPMPAKIQAWMDNIATAFPEMASECQMLKSMGAQGWWAWCGGFVQSMLSYSNIRGPFGPNDTDKWPWAKSWANWGTKVWMPSDGPISNAQPMPGDVLVWSFGHVSFYDHIEPDTDTFSSCGGDQGTPLRVCIEDIDMGSCIAIRRPPQ